MGRDLAADVGVPTPTVMSQRDVPSITRAVIPRVVNAGVIGINVGINTASSPIDVPFVRTCLAGEIAAPFVWRDAPSTRVGTGRSAGTSTAGSTATA